MAQRPLVVIKNGERLPVGGAIGNVFNFCSWGRLVDELRASGEIKEN
jgi:hypothetical protein